MQINANYLHIIIIITIPESDQETTLFELQLYSRPCARNAWEYHSTVTYMKWNSCHVSLIEFNFSLEPLFYWAVETSSLSFGVPCPVLGGCVCISRVDLSVGKQGSVLPALHAGL